MDASIAVPSAHEKSCTGSNSSTVVYGGSPRQPLTWQGAPVDRVRRQLRGNVSTCMWSGAWLGTRAKMCLDVYTRAWMAPRVCMRDHTVYARRAHIWSYVYIYIYGHICMVIIHTHTHTHIHTLYTHTYTCVYIYIYIYICIYIFTYIYGHIYMVISCLEQKNRGSLRTSD